MMDITSIAISLVALAISSFTFWLTHVKKGVVKMTRPTIICFVPQNGDDPPKVFIRTLLYCTSDRGQYVQNMFIRLISGKTAIDFNTWAYGDSRIVRGSGLFVDKNGVGSYHHFLLSRNHSMYDFSSANYTIEVYVESVSGKSKKVFDQILELDNIKFGSETVMYFEWNSKTQTYFSYPDKKPGVAL
ncbi:hypothetical protein ACWKWU_00445 [Chitinophaga lutea]